MKKCTMKYNSVVGLVPRASKYVSSVVSSYRRFRRFRTSPYLSPARSDDWGREEALEDSGWTFDRETALLQTERCILGVGSCRQIG